MGNPWDIEALCAATLRAAMNVHRELGPGFLEKIYANAMVHELQKSGLQFEREARLEVYYDGIVVGEYTSDLIIGGELLVELKAVERIVEAHLAQVMHYLRCCRLRTALLINFRPRILTHKRLSL